jgi:Lytic polysaccharide mono-oxygenase, cellulose-degrading
MKRSQVVVAAALLASSTAYAHFRLNYPASLTVQGNLGAPQKSAPCGLSDTSNTADNSTKSNMVTVVQEGTMLNVKFNETVAHPGHYRVAIAQTMAQLPADPVVTPVGQDMCGSAAIAPTAMPILGDGLLQHTAALVGEQTLSVQLPPGFTCTNCVLQVVQYMSNHGINPIGGCHYHHCATVTVQSGPPPVDGPPAPPGVDAGADPNNPDDKLEGGCCSANGGPTAGILGAALMALLVLRKRRRA